MARLWHASGGPLLLAALLWCAPAWAGQELQIWAGDPARLAFSLALESGQVLTLEHANSIYDAPVRETYVLDRQGGLVQTMLESPSAGVFEYHGYDPPAGGRALLARPLGEEIRLLSASYEHHRLRIRGETIALARLAEPGRPLILKIVRNPPPFPSGRP